MNAMDIEARLAQLTKRASVFGSTIGGAHAMCWDARWFVAVEKPKIHASGPTIAEAFREAEEELSRHEIARANLGKTLGLEAAE